MGPGALLQLSTDLGPSSAPDLVALVVCGGSPSWLLGDGKSHTTTQPKRRGHFSRCPKQYKHYCIKGRCRFVVAEQTPSCV